MKWEYDELFDREVVKVRGADGRGFNLGVRKNDTEATRFHPDEQREEPTFLWYIERVEHLPQGEELTLEEAKAAVLEAFDKIVAESLQ